MVDRDPMAEAAALAETLRETIANLDARIEERACAIAAEQGHAGGDLFAPVRKSLEQAGEAMRRELMEKVGDAPGAREFIAGLPAAHWTYSATDLFFEIWQHKQRQLLASSRPHLR
ncbi:hypothetical protein [Nonomuraea rhodomycinica]|uniref:Uncharacterized protein n=1 Tax=Nonomuraea rhodomycinica TaxID=1712872 RepID=A0A7Y6IWD6_9ACTN|nr:hypothetical protein [Nonomuraea rhodomycinica]NUW45565.1 hypothetical protein [Nonomuraea rhodomycinica]